VSNKSDTIEINGRRYDVHTGAPVGGPVQPAQPLAQIKIRTSPEHKPAAAKPKSARQSARHAHAHAPTASKLLMRQAVHKPSAATRPRIKAQGALAVPQPLSDLAPIRRAERRLVHAKHVPKSHAVRHFTPTPVSTYPETPAPAAHHVPVRHVAPVSHSKHPQTTAELLEIALQNATSHEQPPVAKQRRHHPRRRLFARSHAV